MGLLLIGLAAAPAHAGFKEGRAAYQSGNYDLAYKEFKKLAGKGMAEARFVLGSMYRFGQGVDLDHAQAAKWFTLAAQQGVPMAQYSLGRLYLKGAGVTRGPDRKESPR